MRRRAPWARLGQPAGLAAQALELALQRGLLQLHVAPVLDGRLELGLGRGQALPARARARRSFLEPSLLVTISRCGSSQEPFLCLLDTRKERVFVKRIQRRVAGARRTLRVWGPAAACLYDARRPRRHVILEQVGGGHQAPRAGSVRSTGGALCASMPPPPRAGRELGARQPAAAARQQAWRGGARTGRDNRTHAGWAHLVLSRSLRVRSTACWPPLLELCTLPSSALSRATSSRCLALPRRALGPAPGVCAWRDARRPQLVGAHIHTWLQLQNAAGGLFVPL